MCLRTRRPGVRISQGAPHLLESDSCSEMNIWCFSSFSVQSVNQGPCPGPTVREQLAHKRVGTHPGKTRPPQWRTTVPGCNGGPGVAAQIKRKCTANVYLFGINKVLRRST